MHIIQLTDIHVAGEQENPYDIDVRSNFLNSLDTIRKIQPDLLVVSGDLCFDIGKTDIYQWIKSQLDRLPFPYQLIPGNHDNTQLMIDCFGLETNSQNGQLFYEIMNTPTPILFLDTSNYTLPETQIEWLQSKMKKHKNELVIFMHHPPMKMGVPYMDDNHGLKNMEQVMELLLAHPYTINIFCGHYHVDKSASRQNVGIHITPSTFFQIDWTNTDFQVDHRRCGFRSIKLSTDSIIHSVIYL